MTLLENYGIKPWEAGKLSKKFLATKRVLDELREKRRELTDASKH